MLLAAAPTASAQFDGFAIPLPGPFVEVDFAPGAHLDPVEKRRIEAINFKVEARPQLAVPAPRFALSGFGINPTDEATAVDCMTAAIYYEAAYEPISGQRAVAQVILNRLRHPAFPDSVCGVVFQGSERSSGCQFTFTCDGSLYRRPSTALWSQARAVAAGALAGFVETSVGHATHYHASYVLPYWAPRLTKLTTIGSHIFYQWPDAWSKPSAFSDQYAASEAMPTSARKSLSAYLISLPQPPGAVITTVNELSPISTEHVGTGPSYNQIMTGQDNRIDSNPKIHVTNLNVGKSELIETRSRLKDAPAATMSAPQTSIAN